MSFNFMASVIICSDFGAPQNKIRHWSHCFLIYLSCIVETRCHDLIFLNAEFYTNFFTLLFHFHTEALYSALSAIRVVSSAYLRLLIIFPAILIPACGSSSPAFLMMDSAYKLNKHDDNIQPSCTAFLIWNQFVALCPVLTVAS